MDDSSRDTPAPPASPTLHIAHREGELSIHVPPQGIMRGSHGLFLATIVMLISSARSRRGSSHTPRSAATCSCTS